MIPLLLAAFLSFGTVAPSPTHIGGAVVQWDVPAETVWWQVAQCPATTGVCQEIAAGTTERLGAALVFAPQPGESFRLTVYRRGAVTARTLGVVGPHWARHWALLPGVRK